MGYRVGLFVGGLAQQTCSRRLGGVLGGLGGSESTQSANTGSQPGFRHLSVRIPFLRVYSSGCSICRLSLRRFTMFVSELLVAMAELELWPFIRLRQIRKLRGVMISLLNPPPVKNLCTKTMPLMTQFNKQNPVWRLTHHLL